MDLRRFWKINSLQKNAQDAHYHQNPCNYSRYPQKCHLFQGISSIWAGLQFGANLVATLLNTFIAKRGMDVEHFLPPNDATLKITTNIGTCQNCLRKSLSNFPLWYQT